MPEMIDVSRLDLKDIGKSVRQVVEEMTQRSYPFFCDYEEIARQAIKIVAEAIDEEFEGVDLVVFL